MGRLLPSHVMPEVARDASDPLATWSALAGAWLLCLLPRAAFVSVFGIDDQAGYGYFLYGDTTEYWYPLYRLLAEVLWLLAGGHAAVYVGLHIVVHALLGPLAFALARLLGWTTRAAWLSALGVSSVPYLIAVSGRQPQVGVVLVAVAALLVAFAAWERGGFRMGRGLVFAGLGYAMLPLRPNALSLVVALFALAMWRAPQRRPVGVAIGATVLLALGVSASQTLIGAESSLPPVTGLNLYIGNNPDVAEYVHRHDINSLQDPVFEKLPPEMVQGNDPEVDRLLLEMALEFIRTHPLETLSNWFWKGLRYWGVRLEDADRKPLYWNLAYSVPYSAYGLLAIAGSVVLWRKRERDALGFLLVVMLAYWAPHVVFLPTIRYRMTTEIALLLLAARALDDFWTRWDRESWDQAGRQGR